MLLEPRLPQHDATGIPATAGVLVVERELVDVSVLAAKVTLAPRITISCVALNGADVTASGTKTMGHVMQDVDAVVVDLPDVEGPSAIGRYLKHVSHHARRVRPPLWAKWRLS